MKKLLWHSNAPWAPTGYGQQTGLLTPHLAKHYDLAISSFYGLEGSPIKWEGIPVFPGMAPDYGNMTIVPHAARFFDGDPKGGLVVSLMDVWVLEPTVLQDINLACWVPVDHEPAPPKVTEFFIRSGAVPIAMSRFGERMLGRLDPLYVPHAVDTELMQPMDREEARAGSFPDGAFVVGMVAANKGRPSRKGFTQAIEAFARFAQDKPDAHLYLHTVMNENIGNGENLAALLNACGVPQERVRIADQYTLLHNPYSAADMRRVFSAMDVLLNPAMGEGFGIPVLEAQACGVPAIVTDFTAMREVCAAGWHVGHDRYWSPLRSWQAIARTDEIHAALEECYTLTSDERHALAQTARRHALNYDIRRVVKQHFLPALRIAEQRFDARKPVMIPARSARRVAA